MAFKIDDNKTISFRIRHSERQQKKYGLLNIFFGVAVLRVNRHESRVSFFNTKKRRRPEKNNNKKKGINELI